MAAAADGADPLPGHGPLSHSGRPVSGATDTWDKNSSCGAVIIVPHTLIHSLAVLSHTFSVGIG